MISIFVNSVLPLFGFILLGYIFANWIEETHLLFYGFIMAVLSWGFFGLFYMQYELLSGTSTDVDITVMTGSLQYFLAVPMVAWILNTPVRTVVKRFQLRGG